MTSRTKNPSAGFALSPKSANQNTGDGSGHKGCEASGDHSAHSQFREIAHTFRRDPTDTAEFSRHEQPTHHALLGRVSSLLDSAEARHTEAFEPPGSHFRNFLLSEPLDPLPLSNGLPHGLLHNPSDHTEQTAEVSQPDITNPSLEPFSDTTGSTGQTGDIPIQASVLTGLLWATVIGMIAAAIMLLAVWLIISGVF